MIKRNAALALALSVTVTVAAAAVAAGASTTHTHAIKLTIQEKGISSTGKPNQPPHVGERFIDAGIATQTPGGRGAAVDHIKIISLSSSTGTATFTGKVTVFLLSGTQTSKIAGTEVHHPDNSDTFNAIGTYTSGTGAYKGITGHFTATGVTPNTPGSVTTIHLTGTAKY
jgi:hypothetical protein